MDSNIKSNQSLNHERECWIPGCTFIYYRINQLVEHYETHHNEKYNNKKKLNKESKTKTDRSNT